MTDVLSTFLKENPIKTASTIISVVIALVGGVILIDDRYAHAADFNKQLSTVSSQLEINRLTGEIGVLTIRKSQLEDKIFDASAVRQGQRLKQADVKDTDFALERYRNELLSINDQISKKQDLIDKLRTGK